jgi:RNA polymerase sigma-70 factor (ECF subfamily)
VSAQKFEPEHVRLLSQGDAEAQRRFVAHFEPLLRVKVRIRSGSAVRMGQVEDVVQETFARVLTALRQQRIDDPERFGAFVNRVCENVLHELHRTGGRFASLEDTAEPRARDDPEASATHQEHLAAAQEALSQLTERDREIFHAVLVADDDKDEVCRRFQITRDHLRVLVHRAKERFRTAFEQGRTRDRSGKDRA